MRRKEWAKLTLWTEYLKEMIEEMEKKNVDKLYIELMKEGYDETLLNEEGTTCCICRKEMHDADTEWRSQYLSPMCEDCVSKGASYGWD